jgi:hypothetical protein
LNLAAQHGAVEAHDQTELRAHHRVRIGFWRACRDALLGGGPPGNEELTTIAGALLIVLLAVIGITIIRIGQLLWLHLFVGLLLVGPIVVKMASTGYRFARYYTLSPVYRSKGPPELILRSIAPIVVASTLLVFVTGIVLLAVGQSGRGALVELHKVSFIVWIAFTALHVLGHLPALARWVRAPGSGPEGLGTPAGAAGRWLLLGGGLAVGLIIAVALIPDYGSWTAHSAALHHH